MNKEKVQPVVQWKIRQLGDDWRNPEAQLVGFSVDDETQELAIPGEINGYKIRIISFEEVRGGAGLTRIVLPETAVRLEGRPFMERENPPEMMIGPEHPYFKIEDGLLMSRNGEYVMCCAKEAARMTLPSGVRVIAQRAFAGCRQIEEIAFAGSEVSDMRIENDAFRDCTSLRRVQLPKGVELIGDYAFMGCTALEEVEMLESVRYMGRGVFFGCGKLEGKQA